jgi:hypothetical protein
LFARFSAPSAPVYVPGASFLAAAVLAMGCFAIYWWATREPATS